MRMAKGTAMVICVVFFGLAVSQGSAGSLLWAALFLAGHAGRARTSPSWWWRFWP